MAHTPRRARRAAGRSLRRAPSPAHRPSAYPPPARAQALTEVRLGRSSGRLGRWVAAHRKAQRALRKSVRGAVEIHFRRDHRGYLWLPLRWRHGAAEQLPGAPYSSAPFCMAHYAAGVFEASPRHSRSRDSHARRHRHGHTAPTTRKRPADAARPLAPPSCRWTGSRSTRAAPRRAGRCRTSCSAPSEEVGGGGRALHPCALASPPSFRACMLHRGECHGRPADAQEGRPRAGGLSRRTQKRRRNLAKKEIRDSHQQRQDTGPIPPLGCPFSFF